MVDLVEIIMNVGGWLVAATVTLVGIFLLHLWEQWSRERGRARTRASSAASPEKESLPRWRPDSWG